MDRWTMYDLERTDDLTFAISILNQRKNNLNPYSPLANKLAQSIHTIEEIKAERDRFIERISQRAAPEEQADTSSMTEEEYTEYRLEQSRRALISLIEKVECPDGDRLTDVLVKAVNSVEQLQEEAAYACSDDAPEPCDPCQPTQPECGACEYGDSIEHG